MNDIHDPGGGGRRQSQFKPGTSGNRKGRPKGSKNRRTILKEILFSPIAVRQDGKTKRIPAIDLMHHQLINKAAAHDRRAQKMVLKWSDFTGSVPRFEPPGKRMSGVVRFSEFKAATGIDPESDEFMDMYIASKLGRPIPGVE